MNKKYTVKEFCKLFDTGNMNPVDIQTEEYVPYEMKMVMARNVINKTQFVNTKSAISGADVQKYHVDSPTAFIFYCLTIIDLYTEIKIDYKNPAEEFNDLNKRRLIDTIFGLIDEHEMKEFQMVFDLTKSDTMINNNFQRYVEDQIERVLGVLTPIVNGALNQIDSDKIIQAMDRFKK